MGRSQDYLFFLRPDRTVEWHLSCNAYTRVTATSAYGSRCFAIISRSLYNDIRIDRIFFTSEEERIRPTWGIIPFSDSFFRRFLYNFCLYFMNEGLFFKSGSGDLFGIRTGRVFLIWELSGEVD